jgi:signal transduction histidine kinase
VASYLLLAASGVSLIARRRYPAGVLAITFGSALAATALGVTGVAWLALIVAFFSAVQARRRAAAITALVIGYLISVWPPRLVGTSDHPSATFALTLLIGLLVLLSAAELIRSGRQRAQALRRSQEEELRRRASEDRMRMARDLHDVVAHNISVINVQANTALHLMDRQPQRAREALTTINEVSRQAYRIIQEALTNTARHSGSSAATVRITYGHGLTAAHASFRSPA